MFRALRTPALDIEQSFRDGITPKCRESGVVWRGLPAEILTVLKDFRKAVLRLVYGVFGAAKVYRSPPPMPWGLMV